MLRALLAVMPVPPRALLAVMPVLPVEISLHVAICVCADRGSCAHHDLPM